MTGKSHMLAGGLAAGLTLQFLHAPSVPWAAGLVLGIVAGLVPDMDTESSTASHLVPGYSAVHSGRLGRWLAVISLLVLGPWAVASYYPDWLQSLPPAIPVAVGRIPHMVLVGLPVLSIAFLLLSWLLHHLIHHRGATHSLVAIAAVYWLAFRFADPWAAAAIVAGYGSHLLADLVTHEGDSLFWPLYRHPVGLGHIPGLKVLACRTEGPGETRFWRPLLLAGLVGTVLWHLWSLV